MKFSTCEICPTDPPKSSHHDNHNYGVSTSLFVIGILVVFFFYFLKKELMRKGEVQPEVELAAGSRLRQPVDSNIQFNNVQYEYENERWLNYVTPSVIRQQQRMLEQISAPRTLNTYQDYLEPLHVARPRLLEDEPPTYEVPPTYEECTLKPD